MILEQKKSAVDLTELAIGIIVLGMIVSIGAYILSTYKNTQVTSLPTATTINETLTTVTHTGEKLTNIWVSGVSHCLNSTDAVVIPSTNYTLSVDSFGQGTITYTGKANPGWNNTDWKCTYTYYNTSDPRYSLPNNATIGLAEYGNWFKIITIVGIAAVILALIFTAFGRSSATEGGGIGGSY